MVWAQLLSVMVPTAGMLLAQARAYGAYRARLVTHWARLVEEQQQQQQQQQQRPDERQQQRHSNYGVTERACMPGGASALMPAPNPDEWEYYATLRGVKAVWEHAPEIAACAVAGLLCLATW